LPDDAEIKTRSSSTTNINARYRCPTLYPISPKYQTGALAQPSLVVGHHPGDEKSCLLKIWRRGDFNLLHQTIEAKEQERRSPTSRRHCPRLSFCTPREPVRAHNRRTLSL